MLFERKYWPEPGGVDRLHRGRVLLLLASVAASMMALTVLLMLWRSIQPPWIYGPWFRLTRAPIILRAQDWSFSVSRGLQDVVFPLAFVIAGCVALDPRLRRRAGALALLAISLVLAGLVLRHEVDRALMASLDDQCLPDPEVAWDYFALNLRAPLAWRYQVWREPLQFAAAVSLTGIGALFCLDAVRGLRGSRGLLACSLFVALVIAANDLVRGASVIYYDGAWLSSSTAHTALMLIFFTAIYGYVWNVKMYVLERPKRRAGGRSPAPPAPASSAPQERPR